MRIRTISAGIAIACVALVPAQVAAQKHGRGGGGAAHGPSTHATGPKSTTHGNPHTATTRAHGNPHTTRSGTKRAPARATSTSAVAAIATTPPLNPIAQKLQGKPLGARLATMLPAGMTLNTASAGFRNQGQFIAAVHVSQNLGIPFADLKAAMVPTTTTAGPLSLGQAIQKLRPLANSTSAVSLAQSQATRDLQSTATTRK